MDFGFDDKTALVTGGAGRIGSEDCRVLAEEGAEVVVLDMEEKQDQAQNVVSEIEEDGGTAHAVECDLTDRDAVSTTVDALREETGGVDILINNAGLVNARSQMKDYGGEKWDKDMSVNITGTYNITREVFPGMCEREWGRIINMSSITGIQGGFGQASYATTKAALIGFGKTLALEGAQSGVTCNVVAPNIVVGALADMSPEELEPVDEHFARIAKATPMRKLGTEEDVSNLIAFLCSEQASYITGQVVGVTGGVDLFSF